MFVFLLQAVLLLAIAFILGAVVGCLLRTQFNERPELPASSHPMSQANGEVAKPATVAEPPAPTKPAEAKPASGKTSAKSAAGSKTTATSDSGPDDLKRIKGIGRQIEAKLNAAGITRYEQIAKWKKKDVAEFGEKLSFSGRIEREDWVAQARKLAKGEMTEFAKRVTKGKVATSKSAPKRGGRSKAKS